MPPEPTHSRTSAKAGITHSADLKLNPNLGRPAVGLPGRPPAPSPGKPSVKPDLAKAFRPRLRTDFTRLLDANNGLKALLDARPVLSARATLDKDGRKDKVVLVVARRPSGEPVPGLLVRLLLDGELRDHTRTDSGGVALLVHTTHAARHHEPAEKEELTVEILRADEEPVERKVAIPHGRQHQVMEFVLDAPPVFAATEEEAAEGGFASPATAKAAGLPVKTPLDLMDNPLDRLPADFSTDLCEDLKSILGPVKDPILGLGAGEDTDFRKRRVPIVKRLTIPRIGAPQPGSKAPRRYLVRVRQEWTFLGYTLGELVDVEGLDPGAIVREATRATDRIASSVSQAADHLVSSTTESARSSLHQAATIDNLLKVSSDVRTHAVAGGVGFALPPFFGGAVAATAGVSANLAVRNRTDTSLDVNSSLHVARSVVNDAVRTAQSVRRDVQRVVSSTLSQVSPLLSRVTNLLRWTLYENYMVCTHVEDVVEVQDYAIADLGSDDVNLFTDEQIVDLRRILSPGLLEPRLRPHFDVLAAKVNAKRGAALPITAVHVTVDYSAGQGEGTTLTATIGGDSTVFQLRNGTGRATQTVRLSDPVDEDALSSMNLNLVLGTDKVVNVPFAGNVTLPNNATVSRVELAYETGSGYVRRQSIAMGSSLRVSQSDRDNNVNVNLSVPAALIFTEHDPLVVHVNANRTYYFGLLCQAALLEPSLRDDVKLFESFNGSHEVWRLPIIGFEGNRALVVKDADESLQEVQELLADPGAATLIQLAAPGAYAEALQGLLKLAVDTEKIHPALTPPLPPVMPPLALIDTAGKTIPVNTGGSTVPVGSGTGAGTGGLPLGISP